MNTVRSIGYWRLAALICASLLCLAAIAAVPMGLGEAEHFVLYRLFGLSRRSTLNVGLLVVVACALSHRSVREFLLPIRALRQQLSAQPRQDFTPGMMLLAGFQLVLVIALAGAAFLLNRNNLLGYIDGQYFLTLAQNQLRFSSWELGISVNPLQGLSDIWFFTNTWWIPELRVTRFFSDPVWQRVAAQSVATAEIFVCVFFLAFWLYGCPARAAVAGWVAILMIMPLSYPALIYDVMADAPALATLTILPLIMVPLWARIGDGPHWLDGICVLCIAALLWIHFLAVGLFAVLAYPFLAVVGTVFLARSWAARACFWRKALWGALLITVLVVSGLPQALVGVIRDTAFQLYPEQLMRAEHELGDGSILLRFNEPFGVLVAVAALAGALGQVKLGTGNLRAMSVAAVAFIFLLLAGSVYYWISGGTGARPIYYEYVMWLVYPILAAPVFAAAWGSARRHLPTLVNCPSPIARSWPWIMLPTVSLIVLHGPHQLANLSNGRPNVFPPAETEISRYLQREAGLTSGSPFRGRVVTMTDRNVAGPVSWYQAFEHDMNLIRAVGNDHRTIGMWYYNIPTLIEFSHTIPPFLYAIADRHLTENGDPQIRTLLNMRRPNVPVLQLLGVRWIINDGLAPPTGTHRVIQLSSTHNAPPLALDEITRPNLGASPTLITPLTSAEQALAWMGEAGLDFEQSALLEGPAPGKLERAADVSITMEPGGGVRVRAASTARSLVIIPFYFSRCLVAQSHMGSRDPELRRANLALTGILFEGRLDATIRYVQAPFRQAGCRLGDLADDRRLIGDR